VCYDASKFPLALSKRKAPVGTVVEFARHVRQKTARGNSLVRLYVHLLLVLQERRPPHGKMLDLWDSCQRLSL